MLEGSQSGEQEELRERVHTSAVDEGAARTRMMQAEYASSYRDRNSKPEKDR